MLRQSWEAAHSPENATCERKGPEAGSGGGTISLRCQPDGGSAGALVQRRLLPSGGVPCRGDQRGRHTTPSWKPPTLPTRLHLGGHCLGHSLAEIPVESLQANEDSEEVKGVRPAHTLCLPHGHWGKPGSPVVRFPSLPWRGYWARALPRSAFLGSSEYPEGLPDPSLASF